MTQSYSMETTLDASFDEAVAKVTEALKAEGFGVLTEIDVKATLKKKIDVDFRPYKILGACNPKLAHKALQADSTVGLLLPCNVVVEEVEGGTSVKFLDPRAMFQVVESPAIEPVMKEATERLQRALASLG
ncbi:MAG: DUF302 domain-containing protein [Polyangiaceae bacterium]